jgi:hypothetical protein
MQHAIEGNDQQGNMPWVDFTSNASGFRFQVVGLSSPFVLLAFGCSNFEILM